MEPIKHQLMVVDTNFEYGRNSTRVNLSAMWKMDPMMATLLRRYELDDKSDSSCDNRYHLVDSSDDEIYISNINTDIRIQKLLRLKKQHDRVKLIKICMRKIKQVTSTFRDPNVSNNKLGKMWVIGINMENDVLRTTAQTTVRDVTNTLTIQFKKIYSLFRCQNY